MTTAQWQRAFHAAYRVGRITARGGGSACRSSRAVALIWWSFGGCRVRSARSAAGPAAKRTPVLGWAVGAADLPGVLTPAGRIPACLPSALALQCLAELALHLFPGTVTLRSSVSHACLPPGQ